jgi:hypothetical protein
MMSVRDKNMSQEDALALLETFKTAVESNDTDAINQVCTRLKYETEGTAFSPLVVDTCQSLFIDVKCDSIVLNYQSDDDSPFKVIVRSENSSCSHAYVYVDSEFEGFDDDDMLYLIEMGIKDVDIINPDTGTTIYKGKLDDKFETIMENDRRHGWLIMIGVILFICTCLAVRKRL